MTIDVALPELGENIKTADVLKVLVAEKESIKKDQPLIEIETEKATVEVPSPVSGIIRKIRVKKGDKIEVGKTIAVVEGEGRGEVEQSSSQAVEKSNSPVGAGFPHPGVEEGHKSTETQGTGGVGESAVSFPRRQESNSGFPRPRSGVEESRSPEVQKSSSLVSASPSVRRFAREIGIDIIHVSGTGPRGHITMDDVKTHARNLQQILASRGMAPTGSMLPTPTPLPNFSRWGPVETQPMSNIRRATAEHLTQAWTTIPHVTQFDKADITELEHVRQEWGKKVEQAGGKLTLTAILLKMIASALKVFPQFNASVSMATQEIIYKKYYHIGVAVDTPRGLLVPVIRNVDQKNILQLSVELTQMAEKTREGKLSLDDMQGGNFTITNLGGIGGTAFTPIIHAPDVAILGVSRSSVEPVWVSGQFVPRTRLPLSLSYDHRVIDGADAARFLRWVVEALEQPFLVPLVG